MTVRLTMASERSNVSANNLSLDWVSLGRLVRQSTLEAVAMHFAALAEKKEEDDTGAIHALREVPPEAGVSDERVEE